MPCSASRVVPRAHRVVGPGTHRGSGPREVHTTPPPCPQRHAPPQPISPRLETETVESSPLHPLARNARPAAAHLTGAVPSRLRRRHHPCVVVHLHGVASPLKDRMGDQRGGSEWELIKILLQRTRPMSQLQLRKTHTNTNRQDNIVIDQLQVLGTIPRSTRGSTREEAKEPIKLGKFLCTDRTVCLAVADCPPGRGGLSKRQAQTVHRTKDASSRKTKDLSKWSGTPCGLSASHRMSTKHTRTVRG
jgi:hypothetical protein